MTTECTRSHPHELMDDTCKEKAVSAKAINGLAHAQTEIDKLRTELATEKEMKPARIKTDPSLACLCKRNCSSDCLDVGIVIMKNEHIDPDECLISYKPYHDDEQEFPDSFFENQLRIEIAFALIIIVLRLTGFEGADLIKWVMK